MSENFSFKGKLNGVEYTDPESFTNALKEATNANTVRSIEYYFMSDSEHECAGKLQDKADTSKKSAELIDNRIGNRQVSNIPPVSLQRDTVERVEKIRDIVNRIADMSEQISDGQDFTNEDLNAFRDITRTSLEKVEYIISGMNATDRKDFCTRMIPGIKHLLEEADSESKDLQYEEAKYRAELKEENKEIESEIVCAKEDYDNNCREIEWSQNRSDASVEISDFFRDFLSILCID